MKREINDYLMTLGNPNTWCKQAFEQKHTADKILADVF